jgi:hypothetical protein
MTTKAWSALALIGCVLIAGCYGSNDSGAAEGQSHWLTLCEDSGDCTGDQICACGVCTVECDAKCGPHGTCDDVEDRAACDDAPVRVEAVCLETCARDADCMASGLACVGHACVAAAADASSDAGNDLHAPSAAGADANTPLMDASAGPTGDAGNSSIRAACEIYATRNTCPGELVCNVDGRCAERGGGDEEGIATLAIAFPMGTDGAAEFGFGGFAVTDDALFWEDLGTTDAGDTHLGNGGIYRLDLATRAVTTISDTLRSPLRGIAVDEDFVYVEEPTRFLYFNLDGSAAGEVPFNTMGEPEPLWQVASGSIYYAHAGGRELRRMTPATGEDGTLLTTGERMIISLASDGHRLFIELEEPGVGHTTLVAVEFDGTGMETISKNFRGADEERHLIVDNGLVFSVANEHTELRMLDSGTGESVSLDVVDDPRMEVRSVADSLVYYALDQDTENDPLRYSMLRSRAGGQAEVLRRSSDYIGQVVAKAGYVYWLEGTRILRKAFD